MSDGDKGLTRSDLNLKTVYSPIKNAFYDIRLKLEASHGLSIVCTHGLRSWEEQAKLYAQGRTTPGKILTYARPGSSVHNYGLAFDICFFGKDPYLEKNPKADEIWLEYGRLVELSGLSWGGRFTHPDKPHAQKLYGMTMIEIVSLYNRGGLRALWNECDSRRKSAEPSSSKISELPTKER